MKRLWTKGPKRLTCVATLIFSSVDIAVPSAAKALTAAANDQQLHFKKFKDLRFAQQQITIDVIRPRYRNGIYTTLPLHSVIFNVTLPKPMKPGQSLKVSVLAPKEVKKLIWQKTFKAVKDVSKIELAAAKFKSHGTYQLYAELIDADGKRMLQGTTQIHKLPPAPLEVTVDQHNRLCVNGNPFFPVWIWHVRHVDWIKDMDVNILGVSGDYRKSDFEHHLPQAKKKGLKCICGTAGPAPHSDLSKDRQPKITALKKQFNRYKDYDQIIAWYFCDEPEYHDVSPEGLSECYNLRCRIDPYRPNIIVNNNVHGLSLYGDLCDILMVDPYLDFSEKGPVKPMRFVRTLIKAARKKVKDRKPVWAVLQAHAMRAGGGRQPTIEQQRCMTYLALANGAMGMSYYAMRCGHMRYYWTQEPVFWEQMKVLLKELKYLTPALLSIENAPTVNTSDRDLSVLLKKHRQNLFLIAVNPDPKPRQVTFKINGPAPTRLYVLSEARDIDVNRNSFKDKFKPYAAHVYTTDNNLPNLNYNVDVIPPWHQREKTYGLTNFALYQRGASIEYSHQPKRHYYAKGLIDGDYPWTSWSGDPQARYPQWVELRFPAKKPLKLIQVHLAGPKNRTDYLLQYPKNDAWQTLAHVGPNDQPSPTVIQGGILIYEHNLDPTIITDRIRISINKPSTEIYQIDAYGRETH